MGKILTLTPAQAQEIRLGILNSYRQESGTDFQPVTYLGAYEDLRTHILSKCTDVPGAIASISLHRLRKLFYYTDPNYYSNDKLEPLSFGDDFVSLLTRFKSTDNSDELFLTKESTLPVTKTRASLLYSGFIILAFSGFLAYKYSLRAQYFFRDDFNSNSVEELKSRGWDFIDFDSSLFYPNDSGVLTLRSARGDYWVSPGDTMYINNLIFRELPKGCFEVTTCFTFPNNFEPFQQCGIFLLDKYKQRNHNIRITYAQFGGTDDYSRGYQILKRANGEATQYMKAEIHKNDTFNHIFYLKIIRNKNRFDFYTHRYSEDFAFDLLTTVTYEFEPKFMALAAFNAYRNFDRGPLNSASSIPARFDWVRVEQCR